MDVLEVCGNGAEELRAQQMQLLQVKMPVTRPTNNTAAMHVELTQHNQQQQHNRHCKASTRSTHERMQLAVKDSRSSR